MVAAKPFFNPKAEPRNPNSAFAPPDPIVINQPKKENPCPPRPSWSAPPRLARSSGGLIAEAVVNAGVPVTLSVDGGEPVDAGSALMIMTLGRR